MGKEPKPTNEIRCYVCNKSISLNQIKSHEAIYVGTKFDKKLYRHVKCKGKLIRNYKKIRKVWKIDPRTRVKPKKKKRRRDKQKTKKEREDTFYKDGR
jgi:hypothetical protein